GKPADAEQDDDGPHQVAGDHHHPARADRFFRRRQLIGDPLVKLNKIYTRTGDSGSTGLVDGSRVGKADPLMAAIGDVDEANSAIGVAIAALAPGSDTAAMLTR